ncbi:hypothetical protein AAGS40_25335 (plasmid) [Paraburkholderia sp. PREW-6R]|uniref:hypothetical protein n=1 Tax=Paraburkholderia sp. PREW-6R TaxID=3141544 RepID=UPI0031F4A51F
MTATHTSSPEQEPGGSAPHVEEDRDPAVQSGTHAPGGALPDADIADERVDKVIPRDPKETALHDHSMGDSDARDTPDETGGLPRAL